MMRYFNWFGMTRTFGSMFTREIEGRNYIRAKPTEEELERSWMAGMTPLITGATPTSSASLSSASLLNGQLSNVRSQGQEDQYWQRHEDDLERIPNPYFTPPLSATPQANTRGSCKI